MRYKIGFLREVNGFTDYMIWDNFKRDFARDNIGNIIIIRSKKRARNLAQIIKSKKRYLIKKGG